jgi:hypothetical protein
VRGKQQQTMIFEERQGAMKRKSNPKVALWLDDAAPADWSTTW